MKESILSKIRKLLEITTENGASEGEVENAMRMIQKLSLQHNIDSSEYEVSIVDIDKITIEPEFKSSELTDFIFDFLTILGYVYNCGVLEHKNYKGKKSYSIIGFYEDRTIVVETFEFLLPAVRNLATKNYKILLANGEATSKNARYLKNSYMKGFQSGLYLKLENDKKEKLSNRVDGEKYELIVVKKTDLIEAYIKENNKPKMVNTTSCAKINPLMYYKGYEDGVNLNNNENKQICN